MKLIYQEQANKSGIYKIVNTHTDRIYIGQAARFKERWSSHQTSLLSGKHHNKFLLNDFKKCLIKLGHDDFLEFHILENTENLTREERNKKEEEWIAKYYDNQQDCYNFKQKANEKEHKSWVLTPEIKLKMSEQMKERWKNPEHRAKVVAHRQRPELKEAFMKNCHTKESIEKMRQSRKKFHGKVISPEGIVYEVWFLREFCKEHNLGVHRNLTSLLKGKLPSIHGWRKYEPELVGIKYEKNKGDNHHRARSFKLVSPKGEVFEGKCITSFCKEHELRKENITAVVNGRRKSFKGWKVSI